MSTFVFKQRSFGGFSISGNSISKMADGRMIRTNPWASVGKYLVYTLPEYYDY